MRLTPSSSRLILIMRSPIRRRSVSIWVSPGPPRKPKPPRCRSRWVQLRTNRLRCQVRWASSTCSRPSRVCARSPNISRISAVRSSTFVLHAFSRLRCWTGESCELTIMTVGSSAPASAPISSTLPLPISVAGVARANGAIYSPTTLSPMAAVRPTASASRACASRPAGGPARLRFDVNDEGGPRLFGVYACSAVASVSCN